MSSGPARGRSTNAGESLRNSCNDFARTLARLPASIMEGLSRSIPRRRSHHPGIPHRLQPPPQAPPLPPPFVPEELFFFSVFEQQYGERHPFFYGCRFADAMRAARREGKLVFVYLHDPGHPYTEPFCRSTLCSDVVVEFLDANFVSWGAVAASSGEGPSMVASLQPGSFPFCAVVAPVSDESIAVLQQVEGPVSPSELVEVLQRTIDEQGAAFTFRTSRPDEQAAAVRAARTAEEEERRRSAQRLRQEQDAAYLESLRRDQEKERSRKSLQEGAAKPRAGNSLRPRHPGQAAREPTKTTQIRASPRKEAAASQRTEPNTKIMIRFPNGERRQQSFRHTDTIRDVYRFVDSLGIPGIGRYQLVRSYPRKTYGQQQLGMTLGDAGFYPSVALYIEQLE
ncbi:unnamed protein product [Urochloa decumbens]|uniref:UBX domain-containing protein n=1 Tax=Urochloa decumbens TaxID=240449 RepID=A0ABC9G780_9POAL